MIVRSLAAPAPVAVRLYDDVPVLVDGVAVDLVREEWRVDEGWWSDHPIRRRYLELVLADGRLLIVFEDRLSPGSWFAQR